MTIRNARAKMACKALKRLQLARKSREWFSKLDRQATDLAKQHFDRAADAVGQAIDPS